MDNPLPIKITGCSMGCMYATGPLSKCQCACGGRMHAMMVPGLVVRPLECSPAVAARCKAGLEGGECACACKGVNHGLYRQIEDFSSVRVVGMV